jgi:hypothetical protein
MRVVGETAEVLITVKTSPQPSASYGDTVCVAGTRIDGGRADWIRLYPIPFRWLETDQKFRKYDIIKVEVRRRDQDTRPESFSPTIESIERVGRLDDWKARQPIMSNVSRTTVCGLRVGALAAHSAPSLGMIEVRSVSKLEFETNPGWSESERAKIAHAMQLPTEDLFGNQVRIPPELAAPAFKVRYRYKCMEADCGGHVGQILDWELSELQRRYRGRDDADLKAAVQAKFVEQMLSPKKQTSFFMGNFEDPKKRHNFSVLGVYYPDRKVAAEATLFDF